MSCTQVIVGIHGLDDPEADLIIHGTCGNCGAELWRRRYDKEKSMKLTVAMLRVQTEMDAERDKTIVKQHSCRLDN